METIISTKNKISQQDKESEPRRRKCINWRKEGHRDTPVTKYDGFYLCVDCKDEIRLNKWFIPLDIWFREHNVEQLQDTPGRIRENNGEGFASDLAKANLSIMVERRPKLFIVHQEGDIVN